MAKKFYSKRDFLMLSGTTIIIGFSGCLSSQQLSDNNNVEDSFPPQNNTEWSEPIQIGDGQARTFITIQNENPQYIGIELTEQTLQGLPEDLTEYHLHLSNSDSSIFEWVGIDWTPEGHEPQEIYTVPHFDLHFYFTEESQIETIQEGPANYTLSENQVPKDYIRPPLVDTDNNGEPDTPLVVARMGEHLVDPTSKEFHNESFTHTFIWGAYDPDGDGTGQLTFMEPMVTKEFLEQKPQKASGQIKLPQQPPKSGMYPTQYSIRYHPQKNTYTITLENFKEL